jgi:hypothetical protein
MLIGRRVSNTRNTNFVDPPLDETEGYPYRRVWRSIILEVAGFFGVVVGVVAVGLLVGWPLGLSRVMGVGLALAPLGLWGVFSWLSEVTVPRPRVHLLAVVMITGLVANAVGYPLLNGVLDMRGWITRGDGTEQLLAYVFGYGVIQEVLKYMVVRHTVWQSGLRTRYDAVAYGAAGAVAYATVFNLHLVLGNTPPPETAAVLVFGVVVQHLIGSLIVAYGVAETRLGRGSVVLMVGVVALAGLVNGVFQVVKNNITNTRLGLGVSDPRVLFELVITVVAVVVVGFSVGFLVQSVERAEAQARGSD